MSGGSATLAELLYEIAEVLGEIAAVLSDLVALECEKLVGPTPTREKLARYPACRSYVKTNKGDTGEL